MRHEGKKFEYYTLRNSGGRVDLLGWGTYPPHSVLAGQAAKIFLGSYETEEEAIAAYKERGDKAELCGYSNKWTEPQVSLNHLPDTGDI